MSKEEIIKTKDSLPHTFHKNNEFNCGTKRLLCLVAVAILAILAIGLLTEKEKTVKGNNIRKITNNNIEKKSYVTDHKTIVKIEDNLFRTTGEEDFNETDISKTEGINNSNKTDASRTTTTNGTNIDNVKTANKLGSTVNEKIDLRNYKNKSENIKSVYKIYDMSEEQNGYLVQVTSEKDLLLAVLFDNIGEKVLSVKVLEGFEELEMSSQDSVNKFIDQFNRIKAPVSLKVSTAFKQDNQIRLSDEPYIHQSISMVDAIIGEEDSSEEVIQGINDAYRFLQSIILIDSKSEDDSKKL